MSVPPLVAAFNHKETLEKDGGYYRNGGLEDDEMANCDLAS